MFRGFVVTLLLCAVTCVSYSQAPRARRAKQPDAAAERAALQAQLSRKTPSQTATSTCSYIFTTGSGQKYLQTCVTVNGNIVEFQTPSGAEHIRVGAYGEGYGICDTYSTVRYYDYADYGDTGNWAAPVTLSSTATSVKIQRTTGDGAFTLTQTIAQSSSGTLKITMALKNNIGIKLNVVLVRWADIDANNTFVNNFDSTHTGVVADVSAQSGMSMQNVPPWTYLSGSFVTSLDGNLDPCILNSVGVSSPELSYDGGGAVAYYLPGIGPGSTKTVSLLYSGR